MDVRMALVVAPPRIFAVRRCLMVILNEEWEHRVYAERVTVAVLDGSPSPWSTGQPRRTALFDFATLGPAR